MTYTIATVGCQWGDEGKGKVVALLANFADVVARYGGADNAGHTVVINGVKYALHLLPSGSVHSHTLNVLGRGMQINPPALVKELAEFYAKGMNPKLRIATQAHMVCDWHNYIDAGREEMLAGNKIGTTKKGVGPSVEDKAARKPAIRFEDILDEDECARKVRTAIGMHAADLVQFHPRFKDFRRLSLDEIVDAGLSLGFREKHLSRSAKRLHDAFEEYASEQTDIFSRCGQFLAQYACPEVRDVIIDPKNRFVLLEGAQGHFLDPDHGTFPYVTSTSPLVAGALQYLGLSRREVEDVVGVFKAYCTRVGNGVFDTEQDNSTGQRLRDVGKEYGTTTGRPRRCGWFNITEAKEAIEKNGVDWIALMKLDVLDGMDKVYVGERLGDGSIKYHEFRGWKGPIRGCREYNKLPGNARKYIEKIYNWIRCEPGIISVGPEEQETIIMPDFRQRFRKAGIDLDSVFKRG